MPKDPLRCNTGTKGYRVGKQTCSHHMRLQFFFFISVTYARSLRFRKPRSRLWSLGGHDRLSLFSVYSVHGPHTQKSRRRPARALPAPYPEGRRGRVGALLTGARLDLAVEAPSTAAGARHALAGRTRKTSPITAVLEIGEACPRADRSLLSGRLGRPAAAAIVIVVREARPAAFLAEIVHVGEARIIRHCRRCHRAHHGRSRYRPENPRCRHWSLISHSAIEARSLPDSLRGLDSARSVSGRIG